MLLRIIIVVIASFATVGSVRALEVPQEVQNCLLKAKEVFIDVPPRQSAIKKFVDAQSALRAIRNPVDEKGLQEVYASAYRFAQFVYSESKKRAGTAKTQIHITDYHQGSIMRIIKGRVGNPDNVPQMTRFTIRLAGASGCRASNFVVAGVRGMLDDVPRR